MATRASDLARLVEEQRARRFRRRNGEDSPQGGAHERVEVEADQMPGQDSFLDVITNIVGILILLVLVVACARSGRFIRADPQLRGGACSGSLKKVTNAAAFDGA